MRASLPAVAALLAASLLFAGPAARAEDDPFTLRVGPFKQGFTGWEKTGGEKVWAYDSSTSTLTIKGTGIAKDAPRLVYSKVAWDRGGIRFQAKKGAKKLRVVLQPVPAAKPVALEFPKEALGPGAWTDLGVRLSAGKASLLSWDADGKETEHLSSPVPEGVVFRMGFEAPSGTEAVLTGIAFVRVYEEEPQVAEEGFEPAFDGTSLGAWNVQPAEASGAFTVERGLILGTMRSQTGGWLFHGRPYAAYELRLRAIWGTTGLMIRAVEAQGREGKINKFDTIQLDLKDNIDPESVNDVVVKVAEGTCTITVNAKQVFTEKVKPFQATGIGLFLNPGQRFLLRDIRIKDLAPGAVPDSPTPEPEKDPEAKEDPGALWNVKGAVARDGATWTVPESEAIAGIVCVVSNPTSYDLRFHVAKGAEGLSVVPRAGRGLDRAAGIRIGEDWFSKEEWSEVVLKVRQASAKVTVGGVEVGSLEVDETSGPPGIRVAAGGKATFKDLKFTMHFKK
jgi:hypothetical protein